MAANANEEIDSISLGLKGNASNLLSALTRGANGVVKFTQTVTREAEKATTKLDALFTGSAKAVAVLQTPLAEISPEMATLSGVIGKLAQSLRQANTEFDNTGKTTRRTTTDIENSATAVNRLSREYKAGAVSTAEYATRLEEMARTAVAGSEKQIAALTRLRELKTRMAQDDARIHKEAEALANQRIASLARAQTWEKEALDKRVADEIKAAEEIEAVRLKTARKQNQGEAGLAHGLGAAGNALTMGVTAPVLFGGWEALKASSSLNESQSKTSVIFKESAKDVLAWAKTTDTAMAISERAALDEAASIGAMLINQGRTTEQAAEQSKALVNLAGDYASLKDVRPEIAMTKFRAALSGVSKPLREWGIDVSVAALKAEAYASGIAKPTVNLSKLESAQFRVGDATMKLSEATTKYGEDSYEAMKAKDGLSRAEENLRKTQAGSMGQLNAAQKAQAAYNLILKHSSAAQGDFARTADQEANSRRRLQAELENLAAAYGKLLIPALVKAEHALEGVVQWFKELSPEQKQNVVHVLEFAAALGPSIKLLEALVKGFILWQKASLFLKDLPQLLTGIAAKMTAVEVAEEGAAANMTLLSGATALAEGAFTSMGIAGVTGLTAIAAIAAAGGVLLLTLAALASAIYWIKKDWDVVAETMAMNKETEAANAESDSSKTGVNARLKRQYATVTDYQKFLNDGKGDRAKFMEDMSDEQKQEFESAVPADKTPMVGGRYASNNNPIGREKEAAARALAQIDTDLMASQSGLDRERDKKKAERDAATAKIKIPKPPPAPHIPHVPAPSRHGGGGGASYRADIAPPSGNDLEPLEQLLYTSNVMTLPTNAKTYGMQKQELEDRAANQEGEDVKPGQHPTEFQAYTQDKMRFGYARNLAETAEANTEKTIIDLLAKEKVSIEKRDAAYAAANAEAHRQNALRQAGTKLTQADAKAYADLKAAYQAASAVVKEDKHAIEENRTVHRQAVNDKISAQKSLTEVEARWDEKTNTEKVKAMKARLATGDISRDQLDKWLGRAIDDAGKDSEAAKPFQNALDESAVARANAVKDLHLKGLQLDGKDFDARREAVTEEADNYRKSGAKETDVQAFVDKSNKRIGQDEWEQGFHENQNKFQEDLEAGETSLEAYKAFLQTSMTEAGAQFTAGSSKVSALRHEIERVTWQQAEAQAEGFKRATDEGGQSIEAYVAQMKALQASLPETSAGYKHLGEQIDATNRKIRSDAHQTADRIGSEYGAMFVKVLRRTASFGQMLRETLNKAADDAIAGMVKRWLSSQIFKIINRQNQAKQAAEDKQVQAANVQQTAAVTMEQSTNTFKAGVKDFGDKVDKLAASLDKAGTGSGNGSGGLGGLGGVNGASDDPDTENANASANAAGGAILDGATRKVLPNGTNPNDNTEIAGAPSEVNQGTKVAMSAAMSGAAGPATPWIIGGIMVASVLSNLLNKPQKPDYVTKMGSGQFSSIGQGDHTGLIDSGYSGVGGMRQLASSRAARNATGGGGKSVKNYTTLHSGAIVIQSQPHHDEEHLANLVMQKIDEKARFGNSLTGND